MFVHQAEDVEDSGLCSAPGRDTRSTPCATSWTGGLCVVTGAAGFIGSHLVDALLARGATVAGIDNLDPWYDPARKRANLEQARRHPAFTLLEADLAGRRAGGLLRRADVVFHLAGQPGVQNSWGSGFSAACRANLELTQRVYEEALAGGVRRVVYASSSSVYGTSPDRDRPRPISPYGVTKLAGEHLADVYRARGLTVTNLRYFTVYGPRQRPDMAMYRLLAATSRGGPGFVRRGDGRQRREFTYVDDVVAATMAAATTDQAADGTFDVGGGSTASLNEVIDHVARLTGHRPRVRTVAAPAGDPESTRADLTAPIAVLGWRPLVDLATGLRAQARWQLPAAPPMSPPGDPLPVPTRSRPLAGTQL